MTEAPAGSATAGASPTAALELRLPDVGAALDRAMESFGGDLPDDVASAARHGVTGGGKRLRPVLCVTAFEACGGKVVEAVFDLAASLELVHAYSLMHDDLPCMDDAELRRGRPTTHREHGEAATVRGGAARPPSPPRSSVSSWRPPGRGAWSAANGWTSCRRGAPSSRTSWTGCTP